MVDFPAPIGGTPFSSDFAPSLVFAILYALLLPLMLYRMFDRRSRTFLLVGTVSFSVERIVIYSLRALQSRREKERLSNGLLTYMQISFGMGFIGIANDLVNIIRCVMVNPTFGSDMYYQSPAASTKGGIYSAPPPGTPDQPKLRKKCRDWTGLLGLAFLGATVPGIIAQSNFSSALTDQSKADKTQRLRIVSTVIALFLCFVLIAMVGWSSRRFPNNSKRAAAVASGVSTLMAIVAIYRVSVMHVRTTSLLDPSNPLNKPSAKAAFYVFHSLPEWLAIAILFYCNVRKLFGTGVGGDYRWKDMSVKEKERWEKRQAKKEAKKRSKAGLNDLVEEIPMGEKGTKNGLKDTNKPELVSA